ncbi:hypothetical protein [Sphingomonas jaspsi]|uniref:hypothetical protein n=1 Tax=Sphingomonas jaspsi TaxID=392409 RepID=UPI0004B4E21E|nr:hypothetical protein [Sphingomonas jaspsi]
MTNRRGYAAVTTLGWANYDKPEIHLSLYGPRGGDAGGGCISPAEARKLAAQLVTEADKLEAPDA